MMRVDGAEPAHRSRDRNLQPLGELEQIVAGAAVAHALPDDDARALGAEQHVNGLDHAFGIGAATARDIGAPLLRVRRFLGGRFHEHVEGHVEHHRARAVPVTMVFQAWRTASGTISPRVGWNTLLQYERTVEGKSAW